MGILNMYANTKNNLSLVNEISWSDIFSLVTEIIFYDRNMAKVSVVMFPGYLMP